jgi:hypothetical protein
MRDRDKQLARVDEVDEGRRLAAAAREAELRHKADIDRLRNASR